MNRSEMAEIRKKLADYWGLSEKEVHVGTKGRVVVQRLTDKTPGNRTGIVFWDEDDLYEYLEDKGLA